MHACTQISVSRVGPRGQMDKYISTTKEGLPNEVNPWICALGLGVKQNRQKNSIGVLVKLEGPEPVLVGA